MITSQSPVEPVIRRFLSGVRVSTSVMRERVLCRFPKSLPEAYFVEVIIQAGGELQAAPDGLVALSRIEAHRPGIAGIGFELGMRETLQGDSLFQCRKQGRTDAAPLCLRCNPEVGNDFVPMFP